MSKNNSIYDLIIGRLVTARYPFGTRLLVKALAVETGASRQPIMSALNRLSADGFVRIIPQVGCQVVSPSRDEIADFFLMFQRLEGVLAELAALRRSEDDLQTLKQAQWRIAAHEAAADRYSPEVYADLNREFHATIHAMAHSPLLAEKQRSHFNMSDFFITHSAGGFVSLISDGAREHDRIIDAIVGRDAERARQEAEAHIAAVAATVLSGLSARDHATGGRRPPPARAPRKRKSA